MKNKFVGTGSVGRVWKLTVALIVASAGATCCLFGAGLGASGSDPSKNNLSADAPAVTPYVDIASAGPLTHVYIGNELSCQVAHVSDTVFEFFPASVIPGDSGTMIALGGTLYTPDFNNHGGTATGGLGVRVVFTPISQTPVTGTGTAANPFTVITVVAVGTTGLTIQQNDTYVTGDEAYRTTITITNTGSLASGVLYRAADAFLGGSDSGYGFTEVFGNRKAVGCSVNPNNSPAGRIEEWVPLTGGNNFYQNHFGSVWSWIATKAPFPDTCACSTFQDNGAGISWNFTIPTGGSATFAHVTTFSPLGLQALITSKTADSATSTPGAHNGYTITIENTNPSPVTLNSITDTLPTGFSYVSGSSSGVTSADPTVSGQTLTWAGPLQVSANSSVSLHFGVVVASAPGNYFNEAGGEASGGYTVTATGPTAPITVTGGYQAGPISPYYITSGQQGLTSVVQFDALVNAWIQQIPNFPGQYPISVLDTVRIMGSVMDSYSSTGSEYTRGGVWTGRNFPLALPRASFWDGATDGTYNYSVDFNNGGVYRFNSNWGTPVLLFSTPPHYLGITVASASDLHVDGGSNQSLWISQWESGVVENRRFDGSLISSFSVPFTRISCLAFDPADGTLWMGSQSTLGTFYQYAQDGTPISTRVYSALTSQNTLGGEFPSDAVPAPSATPTPSPGPTPTVSVVASPTQIDEGKDGLFVITRSNVSAQPLTVGYVLSGTARRPADYSLSNNTGQVVIPAGSTSANVVVHALTDQVRDRNETVIMTLSNGAGFKLSSNKKKATIKINDVR